MEMTSKYRPILWWPQKNIHKIFIPKFFLFCWKPQKVLKFKILNPPPPHKKNNNPSLRMYKKFRVPTWDDIKLLSKSEKYIFSQAVARYWMIYLSLYDDVVMMSSGKTNCWYNFSLTNNLLYYEYSRGISSVLWKIKNGLWELKVN